MGPTKGLLETGWARALGPSHQGGSTWMGHTWEALRSWGPQSRSHHSGLDRPMWPGPFPAPQYPSRLLGHCGFIPVQGSLGDWIRGWLLPGPLCSTVKFSRCSEHRRGSNSLVCPERKPMLYNDCLPVQSQVDVAAERLPSSSCAAAQPI